MPNAFDVAEQQYRAQQPAAPSGTGNAFDIAEQQYRAQTAAPPASGQTQEKPAYLNIPPSHQQTPQDRYAAPHLPGALSFLQPVADFANAGANSGMRTLANAAAAILPENYGGRAARKVANEIPQAQSTAEKAGAFTEGALEMARGGSAGESIATKLAGKAPGLIAKAAPYLGQAAGSGATAAAQSNGDPLAIGAAALPPLAIPGAIGATKAVGRKIIETALSSPATRKLAPEAIQMAERMGVPLNQGAITGSHAVQSMEKIIGHTVGADKYATLLEQQQAGLNKGANAMLQGNVNTPYEGGQAVFDKLQGKIQNIHAAGKMAYNQFGQLAEKNGGFPVNVSAVKKVLQPTYDSLQWQLANLPEAQKQMDPGWRLLSRFMTGADHLPAQDAENILSGMKSISRDAQLPELRNQAQGIAALSSKTLQPAIDRAVGSQEPAALTALQEGRKLWAQKHDIGDLWSTLGGADPAHQVSAYKKLLAPQDAGFDHLQKVLKVSPDAAEPLKQAYLSQLFEKPTAEGGFTNADGALAQWSKMGKQTKQALFGDQQAGDISVFLHLAKRLNENPNPSGTGTMNALLHTGLAVMHPMTGIPTLLFSRKMADVLFNPEGAKNLRVLLSAGAQSDKGRKAINVISSILSQGVSSPQGSTTAGQLAEEPRQ